MKLSKEIYLVFCLLLLSCASPKKQEDKPNVIVSDLPQLKESGELRAATLYSSTSYFEYRAEPMGYEYELIKDFARSQGLHLSIVVAENQARLEEMLVNGEADVSVFPHFVDKKKTHILYCGKEEQSAQVLVQRAERSDTLLTDVTQLIGKDVYVSTNDRFSQRLENLNEELGGGIRIRHVQQDTLTSEDLIKMVSTGAIPYVVCDERTARLNKTYYWNIDVRLQVSFPQRTAWIVREDQPLLAAAIDQWAETSTKKPLFKAISKRYFEQSKRPLRITLPSVKDGQISPYDNLFQRYASRLEWDWKLLASIAYQESRFIADASAWSGATGLMGIMPNTARALGASPHELTDPEANIRVGVECLFRFRKGLSKVKDPEEKIKFTLASYNAGLGHVYDAQRLAAKYGKDPLRWDGNVAEYIRLKSEPKYYNDSIVKHGYLRGSETFLYVEEVMQRFNTLKK